MMFYCLIHLPWLQMWNRNFLCWKGIVENQFLINCKKCLKNNNGLRVLEKISKILDGNFDDFSEFPNGYSSDDIVYFKYVLITSVDVERSFVAYRPIQSNSRKEFVIENLRKHLIIQCNNDSKIRFQTNCYFYDKINWYFFNYFHKYCF